MLDDNDEFGPDPNLWRESSFWFPIGYMVGKTTEKEREVFERITLKSLRKGALSGRLLEEPLFDLQRSGRVSGGLLDLGRGRKGQPYTRVTPLLRNHPRTTPKTAQYLPDRQHSKTAEEIYSQLEVEPLDDKDEFTPRAWLPLHLLHMGFGRTDLTLLRMLQEDYRDFRVRRAGR